MDGYFCEYLTSCSQEKWGELEYKKNLCTCWNIGRWVMLYVTNIILMGPTILSYIGVRLINDTQNYPYMEIHIQDISLIQQ